MLNRPEGDDERFRLPSRVDTVAALVRGQVQFAVVVTLAAAWLVVTAIDDTARLRRGLVTGVSITLGAATAVLLVGLGWFPDFDDDVLGTVELGPSWGLWPPAAAALGVLLSHRSLIDLNEIDRPR